MREFSEEKTNKIMNEILQNKELTRKMLLDFGFDDVEYNDEDMEYIIFTIINCCGIKNKVKSAKAIYLVQNIAYAATQANSYEEFGRIVRMLLEDNGVINKEEGEE